MGRNVERITGTEADREKPGFEIRTLRSRAKAEEISRFLLSEDSFDDNRHTPGELAHYRQKPAQSLEDPDLHYWYIENGNGEIIAVNSFLHNEQKTGGYSLDYIAVHREYRRMGIARLLIERMLEYLEKKKARYVISYTCDLQDYIPMRRLLSKLDFRQVGHCPDYYFEGEGRLIYYKKLEGI